jgi:hypothetical protein
MADMVQVEVTDAYRDWYLDLQKNEAAAVDRKVKMLQMLGVARNAVLIIGGDKSGDKRFYERITAQAERLWEEYLAQAQEVEPK